YFKALRPGDVVATKGHAGPASSAIQCLRGRLAGARLATLRAFGGLQAYPSRRKNPDVVDLSTGSMGLGAVMTTFGALATRYLVDHGAARAPERFVVMVGDAELDEGNVWEALGEAALTRLGGDVLWIVDVNRQSLDRVVPETRTRQLGDLFRAHGWRVRELRWGRTPHPIPATHRWRGARGRSPSCGRRSAWRRARSGPASIPRARRRRTCAGCRRSGRRRGARPRRASPRTSTRHTRARCPRKRRSAACSARSAAAPRATRSSPRPPTSR